MSTGLAGLMLPAPKNERECRVDGGE
ncbi:hypothetical protein PIIN_11205 [Serendipita indica DSM 11827]|uniref:Uncharacterized protein n=1 Tax=Serendipita indica (strain DSM 11827) TaxID=1109443 RepID=G4U0Y0_SERID|nr:hypothetical protein PIIN_11205 [Serendipita indica DSM 11827]